MEFGSKKEMNKFVSEFIALVGVKPHYTMPYVESAIRIFKSMIRDGEVSDTYSSLINTVSYVMSGFEYALSTSWINDPQVEAQIRGMSAYVIFKQSVHFALMRYIMGDVVYHYNGRTDMLSDKTYPIINKEK